MVDHSFSFEVRGKKYTAKFVLIDNGFPKLLQVFDISPRDYSPEQPYVFTINPESADLNFALKDTESAEYGVPISRALIARLQESGHSLFEGEHDSGHAHKNSI